MDGCQPIRQFSLALALFSASVALLLSPDDTQKPLHTVSSVVPEFSLFEPGLIALGGGGGVGSLHWVVVWTHCTGWWCGLTALGGGGVSGVLAQEAYVEFFFFFSGAWDFPGCLQPRRCCTKQATSTSNRFAMDRAATGKVRLCV